MTGAPVRIASDLLTEPLVKLWSTLLDLAERVPRNWTLIGGQMVLLHGLEHERTPPAASADLDVLADVITDQQSLRRLVSALDELGFDVAGASPEGKVRRYSHVDLAGDSIVVDVLAPDNVGDRADLTTTPPGVTLQAPGGRQAVQRSERVRVLLGQREGLIPRPNLLGAIIAKAAALSIPAAPKNKHYRDLAFLLSLPTNPLDLKQQITRADRKKLGWAEALRDPGHEAWRALDDVDARADGQALHRMLLPAGEG